jgi:hypothetical protein
VERRKVDIFSTCVFNNLPKISPIFHPFFLVPQQNLWVDSGSGRAPRVW